MKRGRRNQRIIQILLLSFFFIAVSGSYGWAQSAPKKGGTVNVGINTDIPAVDPHQTSAMVAGIILKHVFESLVGLGEKLEFVPILAERWEISADFKTYTFFIRKGKLFHNGREMTAEDVKYSMERMMDPKTGFPHRSRLMKIHDIEAVDKYTVRFRMKESDAGFLATLSDTSDVFGVLPREEVEKQGGIMKSPVGTGPFKFVEWKPDRFLILERFDGYKPQPGPLNGLGGERIAYVDRIKFVPIKEESVAVMALLNKEVDFLQYFPVKYVEKHQKEYGPKGIVLDEFTGLGWYQIFFGCNRPVTSNLKFRQACAHAIDLQTVLQAATQGHGAVNPSFIPAQSQYYTPAHKTWYSKDVNRAKQLLQEAGYKGEEVVIDTSKRYISMFQQAVAVQAELGAAGIKTKLNVLEWPVLLNKAYKADHQILSYGIGGQPDPALAYAYLERIGFEEQFPKAKELREASMKTMDPEVRKKLFAEIHKLQYEGVPAINFYNNNILHAYWNYLKGYRAVSWGHPRFWGVWLDK